MIVTVSSTTGLVLCACNQLHGSFLKAVELVCYRGNYFPIVAHLAFRAVFPFFVQLYCVLRAVIQNYSSFLISVLCSIVHKNEFVERIKLCYANCLITNYSFSVVLKYKRSKTNHRTTQWRSFSHYVFRSFCNLWFCFKICSIHNLCESLCNMVSSMYTYVMYIQCYPRNSVTFTRER